MATGALSDAKEALVGAVTAFDLLSRAVALAALIFTGGLIGGLGSATTLFVLSSCAVSLSMLWQRAPVPLFGAVQDVPLAVLLPVIFAMSQVHSLPEETRIATVHLTLALTSVITALAMLVLGRFRMGKIVRYVPYPVATGFLASTGALLLGGAVHLMLPSGPGVLRHVASPEAQGFALACGLALIIALAARRSLTLGPVLCLVLAIAGFYLAVPLLGHTVPEAQVLGWLPQPASGGPAIGPVLYMQADLALVLPALPSILTAVALSVIALMLNIAGIEAATGTELETDSMLRGNGLANLGLGFAGGPVGYSSAVFTTNASVLGGTSLRATAIACLLLLLAAPFAATLGAAVPRFVTGGLLLYVGASIVWRNFFGQRRALPLEEWLLTGGILVCTVVFGILTAIAMGTIAAALIFAVTYARLPVVRSDLDLSLRQSTNIRGPQQRALLDAHAGTARAVMVQGYLFFGSAEKLAGQIRPYLYADPRPEVLILDMRRVTGADSAALSSLGKLGQVAQAQGVRLVLAETGPALSRDLERQGICLDGSLGVSLAPDTDSALEAVEDALLARLGALGQSDTARSALVSRLGDDALAEQMLAAMQRQLVPAGTLLIREGSQADDIFLIDSGRLAVLARAPDGKRIRVGVLQGGTFVGEIAHYTRQPRSADVETLSEAVIFVIGSATLNGILRDEPRLAAAWHKLIAEILAERLMQTNTLLRTLT